MDEDQDAGAFGFSGSWREFAPIAFTNLLLTIVTLGIYSFWARTRERRYLWSRTRFIDDRLEWTGTGLELLIGYLLAMLFFFGPLLALQFGIQALILRGHTGAAVLAFSLIYVLLLYLIGVAIFRALRYRLSRTFWHGIRGGSDDQGFRYGVSYLWRTAVGFIALGLMVPWSMTTLWNRRWGAMSFGPFAFEARSEWTSLIGRYLLCYLIPIVAFGAVGLVVMSYASSGTVPSPEAAIGLGVVFFILFYVVLGLIALAYYAAYFREVVGKTTLGTLGFSFEARTLDWLKLMLGNLVLVVLTLGIGYIFVGYRNWSFFVRHMRAYGELHLDAMTQSATRTPGQGEGLLDAFDIGAV